MTDHTLVEVDGSGLSAEEAQRLVADALQAAIDRGTPFAAIVRMPEASPRGSRIAGVAERIRIVKRLRPGLSARCRGLAFVVSTESQQQNAKAIRAADKVWGCPTLASDDHATARAWALARLDSAAADHGNA